MKLKKNLLIIFSAITIAILFSLLTGCASDSLGSPCSYYGAQCDKTPINSWNNQDQ